MKKVVTNSLLAILVASVAQANPAQVSFQSFNDIFYQSTTDYSQPVSTTGWYCEIILQTANAAYNESTTYLIAGDTYGFYYPGLTFHETDKLSTGDSGLGAANAEVTFQYNGSQDYWATWRVYNSADKLTATKYLVVPTWKQFTLDSTPTGDASPFPATLEWTDPINDRAYMKYDLTPVPEPTTMALFGLGGLAMILRRKFRKEV